MQKDWKRDPVWQLVGVIFAAISIFSLILPPNAHGLLVVVCVIGFIACGLILFGKSSIQHVKTPRKKNIDRAATNNSTSRFATSKKESIIAYIVSFAIFAVTSVIIECVVIIIELFLWPDALNWLIYVDTLATEVIAAFLTGIIIDWLEDKLKKTDL